MSRLYLSKSFFISAPKSFMNSSNMLLKATPSSTLHMTDITPEQIPPHSSPKVVHEQLQHASQGHTVSCTSQFTHYTWENPSSLHHPSSSCISCRISESRNTITILGSVDIILHCSYPHNWSGMIDDWRQCNPYLYIKGGNIYKGKKHFKHP